jgi:hypothetical protein
MDDQKIVRLIEEGLKPQIEKIKFLQQMIFSAGCAGSDNLLFGRTNKKDATGATFGLYYILQDLTVAFDKLYEAATEPAPQQHEG